MNFLLVGAAGALPRLVWLLLYFALDVGFYFVAVAFRFPVPSGPFSSCSFWLFARTLWTLSAGVLLVGAGVALLRLVRLLA